MCTEIMCDGCSSQKSMRPMLYTTRGCSAKTQQSIIHSTYQREAHISGINQPAPVSVVTGDSEAETPGLHDLTQAVRASWCTWMQRQKGRQDDPCSPSRAPLLSAFPKMRFPMSMSMERFRSSCFDGDHFDKIGANRALPLFRAPDWCCTDFTSPGRRDEVINKTRVLENCTRLLINASQA